MKGNIGLNKKGLEIGYYRLYAPPTFEKCSRKKNHASYKRQYCKWLKNCHYVVKYKVPINFKKNLF